jgi:hypothetical protein
MVLIGAGGFYYKRSQSDDDVESIDYLNDFHQETLLTEASKPLAPPSMDAFSSPVSHDSESAESVEHDPYPYLPPPKV